MFQLTFINTVLTCARVTPSFLNSSQEVSRRLKSYSNVFLVYKLVDYTYICSICFKKLLTNCYCVYNSEHQNMSSPGCFWRFKILLPSSRRAYVVSLYRLKEPIMSSGKRLNLRVTRPRRRDASLYLRCSLSPLCP